MALEPSAEATDVSKLPTPDDLRKRKAEARDKARATEPATKAEPTASPAKASAAPVASTPDTATTPNATTAALQKPNRLPGSRDDVIALMGERANREGIQNGVTPRQILEAEVANFILAHHQKASTGNIPGMVSDYAATAQFSGKPGTTREAISRDETDYRRN